MNFSLTIDISEDTKAWIEGLVLPLISQTPVVGAAVAARLVIGGIHGMSTSGPTTPQINVDTTGEYAELQFVDDKGNVTTAPAGATVQFASSDATILTVASDANDPLRADITPVAPGTADVSVTLTGATMPDGTTPIAPPAAVSLQVDPGAPAGARVSLANTTPPSAAPAG